jgi:hypothetical protein
MMLFLERAYPPDNRATLGQLVVDDFTCHTLERPWLQNQRNKSCIPEGTYALGLRPSPLIDRITGGEYTEGWEVMNVPNRTFIMFHPGNWIEDTEWADREGHTVTHSRETFRYFMRALEDMREEDRTLVIMARGATWN